MCNRFGRDAIRICRWREVPPNLPWNEPCALGKWPAACLFVHLGLDLRIMEYMLLRFEACYRERTRRGRVGRNADSKQHPSLWRVESIFEISMKFLQKKNTKN